MDGGNRRGIVGEQPMDVGIFSLPFVEIQLEGTETRNRSVAEATASADLLCPTDSEILTPTAAIVGASFVHHLFLEPECLRTQRVWDVDSHVARSREL